MTGVEWWGGAECTVNRVGDVYYDQLVRTGHAGRLEDLDRIAALGVRKVRFPVLWERVWCGAGEYDFSGVDERLERLEELGVEPIVGLVHHGSGPPHTSLLRDDFAAGLTHFAKAVARRYPRIRRYTPVNEPLTTARFSALYGHWYPHARDVRSFLTALLTQVRATQSSMAAIREVNPEAELVQTEDLGTVFSTPGVAYQAAFENQRRWLSLDLLFGRVTPQHPLYHYLVDVAGVSSACLSDLAAHPCPPNIIGINYYVTSDRFLDERVGHYPQCFHGGNGKHAYADVEAVRVRGEGIVGHAALLEMVWRRYRTPMAFTEVHLGCAEEQQVSWLAEAWSAAVNAVRKGMDVRAVTAWTLFGAFDWNSLVTRNDGHYEPGAFDVRHVPPTATSVAEAIRQFARGDAEPTPEQLTRGWWRQPERIFYPAYDGETEAGLASDAA